MKQTIKSLTKNSIGLFAISGVLNFAFADDLTIHVNQINNDKGFINLMVFKTAEGFDKADYRQAEFSVIQKAKKGKMTFQVSNLEKTDYAFVIHHDENANMTMDMNKEMPKEGYAYSKNKGRFAKPKFENAKVSLTKSGQQFHANMIYLK